MGREVLVDLIEHAIVLGRHILEQGFPHKGDTLLADLPDFAVARAALLKFGNMMYS